VRRLLDALIDFEKPLPVGFVDWQDIAQLERAHAEFVAGLRQDA
jgi:hypothetical protein